ncbi:uncharacterized protein EAF01_011123 [Botrytis porri]|uniref:uncharacterized protein n=1 Tax=Botrytis porri TaxID=87229 RepID=UPI001900F843|nr:uncharacterized protein EAF01_011123 [Botrytis porri]KAF7887969.1 hypothetical protein EAF01_011123 [Botrytis porri]
MLTQSAKRHGESVLTCALDSNVSYSYHLPTSEIRHNSRMSRLKNGSTLVYVGIYIVKTCVELCWTVRPAPIFNHVDLGFKTLRGHEKFHAHYIESDVHPNPGVKELDGNWV